MHKLTLSIIALMLISSVQVFSQCFSTQPGSTCVGGQFGAGGTPSATASIQQAVIEAASPDDDFNCHQYVRGVLENYYASTGCGTPFKSPSFRKSSNSRFSALPSSNINTDSKYIELCNSTYAQAISFTDSDHSAIILSGTNGFASTPGWGSSLNYHSGPTWGAGGCVFKYYAYIGNVSISANGSGNLTPGTSRTFSVTAPSYIASFTWTYDANLFDLVSGQYTPSITLRAKCPSSYAGLNASTVSVRMATSCNTAKTSSTSVTVDCGNYCEGKINGNLLRSYNRVTANVQNTVVMAGLSPITYTWTKTSGTASWYAGTGGRSMYVTIATGGSAGFNVKSSTGCSRTVAFGTSGFRVATTSEENEQFQAQPSLVKVFRLDGRQVREVQRQNENDQFITNDLPSGLYIIDEGGKRTKVFITAQ